jgi:6-phosphogluconolactonase (cycloisomerase 2 family)
LFAFVGSSDGKIRSYAVDSTSGGWMLKHESNAGANPSFLAFDPSRRRVVATDESAGSGIVRSWVRASTCPALPSSGWRGSREALVSVSWPQHADAV